MLGYVWDLRIARLKSKEKKKSILLQLHGCIYRHPSQNRECFHEAVKSNLEMFNNEGCVVYITCESLTLIFSNTILTTKHPNTLICY